MGRSNCPTLDALIAEGTVDCYNDSECVTGFYIMLDTISPLRCGVDASRTWAPDYWAFYAPAA